MVNLSQYHWHTGAPLQKVAEDESVRLLFRDIGPQACVHFIEGKLSRLAGPTTPICYWRTADYQEPYTDYANIGRLVSLQPKTMSPWHSGVDHIYVTDAKQATELTTIAYIPNHNGLSTVENDLQTANNRAEVREIFGQTQYDDWLQHQHAQLTRLNQQLDLSETLAYPLRLQLQSNSTQQRQQALKFLQENDLSETDLCSAWHHLPSNRRSHIIQVLQEVTP